MTHVLWLILHLKLLGVVHLPIRIRLDKLKLKVRSTAGQTRSNLKMNSFAQKLRLSDGEFYGRILMVVLVLRCMA